MNFEFSSEHQMVFDTALRFSRGRFAPLVAQMEQEDAWPEGVFRLCGEQGFLGAAIPEEYGGAGGDLLTAALIGQAIGRVSGAIGLSYGAHLNLCAHNILRNGSEAQKRGYLPKLCSGEWVGALGLTEPNHGSDAMGIQTRAVRSGDHYVVNGAKMFITNGPIADVLILYARTDPDAGNRGLTAFIVETRWPGFGVAKKLDKVGMRGSPTGELYFDNLRVPVENVLGEVNQGYKVIMSGLDIERAYFACAGLAVLEEALEQSLKYAQQRRQFGEPIANFQLIQAKLADMYAHLSCARMAVYHTLAKLQQGRRASLEAAAALLYTAETAMRAADEAVQIHGGYGYIKEFPVERLWRDAKLLEIGAGTNEIRRLLIARELLGLR